LWRALRERGLAPEKRYENAKGGETDLALLCALGRIGVTLGANEKLISERGKWRHLAFPTSAVNSDLSGVLEEIERAVRELGGAA
jgi:hypothetical protein